MSWLHAPSRVVQMPGNHIITAATYRRIHHFSTAPRLTRLQDAILRAYADARWMVQAWAFMPNHYHLVALRMENAVPLGEFLVEVHSELAYQCNQEDGAPGRQVFFNYWDTRITFERSLLARLQYVHQNPVKHGLVLNATDYPWCSARHVEQHAPRFAAKLRTFGTERVRLSDEFGEFPAMSQDTLKAVPGR